MINKILVSVYDYYRRKNDSISATFHAKALFAIFILIIGAIFFFFLSKVFNYSTLFDEGEGQIDLKIIVITTLVLIIGVLWFATASHKELESTRNTSEVTYRKYFFIGFYLSIPILLYLIANR